MSRATGCLKDIDTRVLRAYVAVARCGSVTGAARQLGYSQPAVTHQVRTLERMLGVSLFVRGSLPLRLTPHGVERLVAAEVILVAVDMMMRGATGQDEP